MFIDYSNPNKVVITHKGEKYTGYLHPDNFLAIRERLNNYVFAVLSINDPKEFISNIVGYMPKDGAFPELMYKKDLIKILDALNKEYDKKFGKSNEEFKVGDKVLVRNDLVVGNDYGRITFLAEMTHLTGSFVTITGINYLGNISLLEDKFGFWWSPKMFIKVDSVEDTIDPSVGFSYLKAGSMEYNLDTHKWEQSTPLVAKELSWNQLIDACEPHAADPSVEPSISINTFIKEKKSYKLNFNN